MDIRSTRAALVAALAAAAAACASAPADDPGLAAATRAALADAARRSGLAESALRVERAERVTWPDGSLGCPLPDRVYTQALVPGYRIRIRAGDAMLAYHGSLRVAPAWCPAERAANPLPAGALR